MLKKVILAAVGLALLVTLSLVILQFVYDPDWDETATPVGDAAVAQERGAYLARAGDCLACHTARGGKPYAGGRVIATPYGSINTPNITPDASTGIGLWNSDDFWHAMHNGKSRDGRFLYPAFPYPNYSRVTRADSDALFSYLQSIAPVAQPSPEHALRFPYNQRWLLAVWRSLYFRPGVYVQDTGKTMEWNRGAYLVQGLGHCNACHTSRGALGSSRLDIDLAGGLIPMLNWYAPSLTSDAEAGLGRMELAQLVALLKHGTSNSAAAFGPMAEVVRQSLQYLSPADIGAMAGYLKSLPQTAAPARPETIVSAENAASVLARGERLYGKYCADCHGDDGRGKPPVYPPLAGNRALTMDTVVNPVRMVLLGGFPPSTQGNPRPYGMPPFGYLLDDQDVSAVVSYLRNAWGNRAALVAPAEVRRHRGVALD